MATDSSTSRRKRRGISRLWRREPAQIESESASESETGRDIVDQAEAFKFLRVADVMTPRADIVAVDIATPFSELLARFVEAEHSRMPIYRETLDDPVGVVHVKDIFKMVADEARRPGADEPVLRKLRRLRRELLYVPPSMPATALLAQMQASRVHMAMVIDEFGGADGLVTLEDLIEAVVGEIDDEHDETTRARVIEAAPGVFEADARAALEDLEAAVGETLGSAEIEEAVDTVGGLVSALAGRVAQRGEVIAHPGGFEFQIVDADPRRVRRVRVHRAAGPDNTPAENLT